MIEVNPISLTVNGKVYQFMVGEIEGCIAPNETLLDTLRERLHLTAAKRSCDHGVCGCCTVIVDGEAVASCMALTADLDGASVITLEGLADPVTGELSPLQRAFADNSAFQCGYCTPGIIMSTQALLMHNPDPTEEELTEALSGNYCRCISHYQVIRTVMAYLDDIKKSECPKGSEVEKEVV